MSTRRQDKEKLRALILEGVASGRSGVMAEKAYFDGLRQRMTRQASAKPTMTPARTG